MLWHACLLLLCAPLFLHGAYGQSQANQAGPPSLFPSGIGNAISLLQAVSGVPSMQQGLDPAVAQASINELVQVQAALSNDDVTALKRDCLNYGAMALLDNMYFTAKEANPILAAFFGQSVGQILNQTIGLLGPLTRVYLDHTCAPYTKPLNDSLVAYVQEGALRNTTTGQLIAPAAAILDNYYATAKNDIMQAANNQSTYDLPPRFYGSGGSSASGGGGIINFWSQALQSGSDFSISPGEIKSLQSSASESPILLTYVGFLGDVNAQILSLLRNFRGPSSSSSN